MFLRTLIVLAAMACAAQATQNVLVTVNDMLSSVKTVLDQMYLPLEQTGDTVANFVLTGSQPISTPTKEQAGLTTPSSKGEVATALWTSYNDANTNGLWVGYGDSGILGYWNINGNGDTMSRHMYRPGGSGSDTGCPAIDSTATCEPSAWTTAPPASCDAIDTSCQTFHDVNGHGDPTTITKQRAYDVLTTGWWTAAASLAAASPSLPLGQPYWLDLFGSLGYQNSDSTKPHLVGFYVAPVMVEGVMKAASLVQIWYDQVTAALATFNYMDNTVVYIMEADTGELVATSNSEAIFTSAGAQKLASAAATELINVSATYFTDTLRADSTGEYMVSDAVTATVMDYQRASGTMHHKIVVASYNQKVPANPDTNNNDNGKSGNGHGTASAPVGMMLIVAFGFVLLASVIYIRTKPVTPGLATMGAENSKL